MGHRQRERVAGGDAILCSGDRPYKVPVKQSGGPLVVPGFACIVW